MTNRTSTRNSDKRATNEKRELNLADLDAVNGGLASSVLKKMSETSSGVQARI